MKSLHLGLTALGAFFLSLGAAQAQAPVLDGVIRANEYGSSYVTRDQTWYMTWDDTNLYVATTNANTNEASILYFDTEPATIVNDINSPGTNQGLVYDMTGGTLPFRADAFVYIKAASNPDGASNNSGPVRRVTRKADPESGVWGGEVPVPAENVVISSGTREFSIPWSAISTTNARPANFNWFGYITNGAGYAYAQVPYFNPGAKPDQPGTIGTNASFVRYFTTLNTAATGSNNNAFGPNNLDSYTHIGESINGFGALTVYDFTLNTAGAFIIRGDGNTPWDIQGDLRVGNSSLNFGNSASSVSVGGDLSFADPASFTAPSSLFLTGNGNQTIDGDSYNSLTIQGTGTKAITSDLFITSSLAINNGTLVTGTNTVQLGSTGELRETGNGYLVGRVSALSRNPLSSVGASSAFGGIGLTLTQLQPQSQGNFANNVSVLRVTGTPGTLQGQTEAVRTISRRYAINANLGNNPSTQPYNVSAAFAYRTANPNELGGNNPAALELYQSESASNFAGTYSEVLGVNYNRTTANVLRADGPLQLNGTFYSLADGITPLPVELTSFAGLAENNAARLTWATASEKQNKGFEVERRSDQGEWQTLGFVAGNGTTNQRHTYSYVDRAPLAGNNYYRLRQVDLDGKSVYSQPVTVQLEAGPFTLSPVPATDVLTFNGLGAGQHTAEIYNARGQRVLSKEFRADAAPTVAVSALPAGVYLVRVVGADRSARNARFIKE